MIRRRGLRTRLLAGALALAPLPAAVVASRAADAIHEVQPGETLWQIAARLAGDPHRWPEIYRANRDQIKDPSLLYPGQQLAIPDFGARERSREVRSAETPPEDG